MACSDSRRREAFRFFRQLVNYDPASRRRPPLTYDTHLDYFVADSAIDCHRDHLNVGDRHVKVLSMKEPPAQTFAHLLADLYAIPGEFIACLEWQRIPSDRMRRDLQTRRRHFFNKRVSMVNYVSPETRPEEMLVDDSASATVRQLGDALTELEVNGHFFGHTSLTLVLHGDGSARAAAPDGRGHEGDGCPRRQPVRGDLQPPECLVEHRAWQRRSQPAPTGAAGDELR